MSKAQILNDLKRVVSELKRTPSRDEYFGGEGLRALGTWSERQIRKHFGGYNGLLSAAGLSGRRSGVTRPKITNPDGLKVAKAEGEITRLNQYIKELERETLNSHALRNLIGAADTTSLGEGADWLSGPSKVKNNMSGIPTLFLSDLHFNEVVNKAEVNGVNEFNHDIAVARIKHTFQTSVDLTKLYLTKTKYDGFICALGGDLFSGYIHEELAETNDQTILRSIIDLTDLLAAGIAGLADEFNRVFVPCVTGNHGRIHKKPRYKNRTELNFEWLLFQFLSRHFEGDPRVSFLIPDGPDAQWSVYGTSYLMTHGDQFSGGSGISGIFTPIALGAARKQKKQAAIGQNFQKLLVGHFHQYIHTNNFIVNGSLKGYDEYANAHNFAFEPPQQALWITHPTKGEIYRMPVMCDATPLNTKTKASVLSW